ncbi:MAG: hypothetical protein GF313_12460 [Caldithrix sp.]|nr:hypothetical protein [Caldithrix sp.]
MANKYTISIPVNLYEQLTHHLSETSFKNLEDLAAFVLQDYLDHNASEKEAPPDDNDEVRRRLQDLGYM